MYLKKYLEHYRDKKVKLFIDMDGVIADYIFGSAKDYDKKRPLLDSIKKIEEISKMPNIELYIFSATRFNDGFNQKQWWLDTYAPFFNKDKRIILSREENSMEKSSVLKAKYLKNMPRDESIIIVIDDDPRNLGEISKLNDDIILLKDTVLVDDTMTKYMNENIELFIILCNVYKNISWKYKLTEDEFVVGINTPAGVVNRIMKMELWNRFNALENSKKIKIENISNDEVLIRLQSLLGVTYD